MKSGKMSSSGTDLHMQSVFPGHSKVRVYADIKQETRARRSMER